MGTKKPTMLDKLKLHLLTVAVGFLFMLMALKNRGRPTHTYGVAAAGRLKIVDDPDFPKHEFFRAGRVFPIRLRHATVTYDDDATLDLRSAAIKFSDQDAEAPFDLIMNTGEGTFLHAISLWNFIMSRTGGEKGFEALMRKDPESRRLFVESVRRAPESFAKLYYYNELPFHFLAKDGKKRYVRFRMVPEDGPPEVRLPDEQDQETPWLQQRRPGCTLPKDYLRREFRERLFRGPVVYRVQLRLYEATPDDTEEVFSQVIQWDPKTSPWIDLATVTLDRALSEVETERLRFNFARLAPGLGLIEAHSVYDPNSVSHLRARLYPLGQFVRFMLYKLTKKMPGGKSFKEAEEESRAEIGKPIADRKAEHVEVL